MRNIGHLASEPAARKLGDFLYLRGIGNEIEPETDGRWALWIREDDQLTEARQCLERFLANPAAPEFHVDSRKSASLRQQEAQEAEAAVRRQWGRERIFPQHAAVTLGTVSLLLIIICLGVFFATSTGDNHAATAPLKISEQLGRGRHLPATRWLPEIQRGELWRLFTPALLHFGFIHLLFNMLWLKDLGSLIETRLGSRYLLLLLAGIALGSNLAQYWWSGPNFGGMSGVVYGLFGFVWIRGKLDPASGLFLDQQTVLMMLIWFVVCLIGLIGNVANVVHGVGLALGALWGFLSSRPHRP